MAEVFGIVTGVLGLLPLCRGEYFSDFERDTITVDGAGLTLS
jgi:hypothetical protein